jgi:hypothetical protein
MSYTPFSNGQYNSSAPTLTNGQLAPLQLDVNGNLKVNIEAGSTGNAAAGATGVAVPADADYLGFASAVTSITQIQAGTVHASSGTTTTAPLSSNVVVGHTILVAYGWNANDSPTLPTAADGLGNTYTLIKSYVNTLGGDSNLAAIAVFSAPVTIAGSCTVTVTQSGGARAGAVALEYSGLSGALDQFAEAEAITGTTLTTPSTPTTTSASELLFAVAVTISTNPTLTAGSGYTIQAQGAFSSAGATLGAETQLVSATGAYTASISGLGSGNYNALLLVTLPISMSSTLTGVSASTPLPVTVENSSLAVTGTVTAEIEGHGGATLDAAQNATAPANVLSVGAVYETSPLALTNGNISALQADVNGNLKIMTGVATQTLTAWTPTNWTGGFTAVLAQNTGCESVIVQLDQNADITAGAVTWQGTYDGTNWVTIPAQQVLDPTSSSFAQIANPYTFSVSSALNKSFLILMGGYQSIRALESTAMTGSGASITPYVTQLAYAPLTYVQDMADGPVSAGTAAGKSMLTGLVAATSAPSPTAGQQIALQGDTHGTLRTSPYGATGSFANSTATGTGSAPASFTVPAATKWLLKSVSLQVVAANSGSPRVSLLTVANVGGNALAAQWVGIGAPINATTFYTFAPSLPLSTSLTVGYGTVGFPELALGPGYTISFFITNGVAGDTTNAVVNYISYPD